MAAAWVNPFMTDREVAALLQIGASTLRDHLKGRGKHKWGFDLWECEPLVIGKMRRWPRDKVCRVLGIPIETTYGCAALSLDRRAARRSRDSANG